MEPDQTKALDSIRNWSESASLELTAPHSLLALASLVIRDKKGGIKRSIDIHGSDVYLGRFHPQQGPVDILFTKFPDHEIYKFAAPHIRIILENKQWFLLSKAPNCWTSLNGVELRNTRDQHPINHGDIIKVGYVEFVFETKEKQAFDALYNQWLKEKKEIFRSESDTALFLLRHGSVCGPRFLLGDRKEVVVGRAFDPKYDREQPDWDLSGLPDIERKFVAFRHILMKRDGPDWTVEPISKRQKTYVNRLEISGPTLLLPGEEISLGNVLLHFHDPSNFEASTARKTSDLPAVIDWNEQTRPRVESVESFIASEPTELLSEVEEPE